MGGTCAALMYTAEYGVWSQRVYGASSATPTMVSQGSWLSGRPIADAMTEWILAGEILRDKSAAHDGHREGTERIAVGKAAAGEDGECATRLK